MEQAMDSPKLRKLSRAQLQFLARREVIRAIGKTEDIIRRLIQKHPRGVPVSRETNNPSASSTPPERIMLRIPRLPLPESSGDLPDPKGKGKAPAETTSPSPSSSAESLQLRYPEDEPELATHRVSPSRHRVGPEARPNHTRAEPIPRSERASNGVHHGNQHELGVASPFDQPHLYPGQQFDEENDVEDEEEGEEEYPYVKGAPTHYMVVDAFRRFTPLVNSIPAMETRITESRRLLRRTETQLEKATPCARQLTVTREYLETFLLAKMKDKRELWDGTARMEKPARKLRVEWLRAERKAENEKRWREANEVNRQQGLKEIPFSVFASESDEEVIESLQTTPASSGSRSAKRTREESADTESNGDSGIDEGSKKRARS